MDPEKIKEILWKRRKQISMSTIARELEVTQSAVSQVIDRKFVSARIMEAVAAAIGKDKRYVFPEYFLKKAA